MYIHVMVIAIQYTLGVEASALYEARLLVDRQTSWQISQMMSQVDDVEIFIKEHQHDITAINELPPKNMSTTTHVQRYENQALLPLQLSKWE